LLDNVIGSQIDESDTQPRHHVYIPRNPQDVADVGSGECLLEVQLVVGECVWIAVGDQHGVLGVLELDGERECVVAGHTFAALLRVVAPRVVVSVVADVVALTQPPGSFRSRIYNTPHNHKITRQNNSILVKGQCKQKSKEDVLVFAKMPREII
jgi:hypothetical protein